MQQAGLCCLDMMSSRSRGAVRYALACAVLWLAACSGETVELLPERESAALPEGALAWQEGSDGTRTYLGENHLIRCWKLNNRFDCLHAEVVDLREKIADAPVRRSYFRFLTSRLPDRMSQLNGLDISDGYECSVSIRPERSFLLEAIWKNGRVVEKSLVDNQLSTAAVWKMQDIVEGFQKHSISPRRPAFACSLVEEITSKMGLETLDSPLITYDALTNIEPVADLASKDEAAE